MTDHELAAEVGATDLGNAERFARATEGLIHYNHAKQQWMVYDGRRWTEDAEAMVQQAGVAVVKNILGEAAVAVHDDQRKLLARHAVRSQSDASIRAMLRLAKGQPEIAIAPDAFDTDPWLFNVDTGTIDLRTGKLRQHNPADYLTKLSPVAFDGKATYPQWLAFLDRIFDGDAELIAFWQRAVGYILTGQTTEQVLFLLWGFGANGKSTLLEVLFQMLGDYAAKASFDTFLVRRSEGPRNDLAALEGTRLVAASEAGEGKRFDEAVLKELTGGDRVTCRRLYTEWFTYTPTFKVVLATNAKPEIRSTGEAIWRRMRLVPFTVTIPEDQRDRHLVDKLCKELPGILQWVLTGCRAWQAEGLGQPPAVRTATAAYREESDPIQTFVAECCQVAPDLTVRAKQLYQAFRTWAEDAGEPVLSQQAFGRRLPEKGFHRMRDRSGCRYIGLTFRLETVTDTAPVTVCDMDSRKVPIGGVPKEVQRNPRHNPSQDLDPSQVDYEAEERLALEGGSR